MASHLLGRQNVLYIHLQGFAEWYVCSKPLELVDGMIQHIALPWHIYVMHIIPPAQHIIPPLRSHTHLGTHFKYLPPTSAHKC